MKCSYCGGLVLWDMPIRPFGDNQTTCTQCGGHNCQIVEREEDDTDEDTNNEERKD